MTAEGQSRGGHARAAKLSPQRRQEIAREAGKARWHGEPRATRPPPALPPLTPPVDVITARLQVASHGFEKYQQTAFAVIGALEQAGWIIVRKGVTT